MIDKVVEAVREDLLKRSQKGIEKYGVTLDRNDLTLKEWLQHAYEECLDQANYLKTAILNLEETELHRKQLAEETAKEDQGWEDFREGAFNAWKKKEMKKLVKETEEKFPKTMQNLKDKPYPYQDSVHNDCY